MVIYQFTILFNIEQTLHQVGHKLLTQVVTAISSRQITATNGNPGTETLNFSIPGEYRAFSTNVTGEGCAGNTGGFKFNFTDATYNGQCALGPL